MEFSVALMPILLGIMNIAGFLQWINGRFSSASDGSIEPESRAAVPGCTPEAKMCDSLGAVMSELAILGRYSVFLASYVVLALGKFPGMKNDRPGAAIIGAVLMFMTGAVRVENSLRRNVILRLETLFTVRTHHFARPLTENPLLSK